MKQQQQCIKLQQQYTIIPRANAQIILPSRSSSSTHPVSMLKWQALASYFIIIPSKSCYWLTVYDKASEVCAVHGSLHCCTRRKRKIRTLLQSETGSDFSCLVGAGGFEPPKLKSSRFTVCPHWPLGNTPIFNSQSHRLPVYITTGARVCQCFLRKFSCRGRK